MHYRNFFLIALFLLTGVFSAMADEINVQPGSSIQDAINSAQSGDVIVLLEGGFYNIANIDTNLSISGMQLTIKAADNAVLKPEVSFSGFNISGEGNAIELRGIKFISESPDGERTSYFTNFTEEFVSGTYLKVLDCEVDGFRRCALRANRVISDCDSVIFDNCIITNSDESYRLFHFGSELNYSYFQLTNTTVANFTEAILWSSSYSPKAVIIDNCTFNGITIVSPTILSMDGDEGAYIKISDCLFTNFAAGTVFTIPDYIPDTIQHCRYYNVGDIANEWSYMEDFSEEDPQYADADNFDFTLPGDSPLQTAGTDGGPIGDPRWSLNPVSVETINSVIPSEFALKQNYPNPFNPSTQIRYSIPKDSKVTLDVFDMLGRKISTLVNETKLSGEYSVVFDASNLSSGVYIYRLTADNQIVAKTMMLLK